jgi:hypothetical protein
MTDLDELSRLLEQATPGPWQYVTNAPDGDYSAIWHEHYVYAPEARYGSLPGNPGPVKVAYMPQAPDKRPAHDAALIAALRNCAEELVRDARRLARLERMFRVMSPNIDGNHAWTFTGSPTLRGPNLRAAIDAAIAQEQPPDVPEIGFGNMAGGD